MNKYKPTNYAKKFKFADNQDEYEFQLKKRSLWWLWLLLALLLLGLLCIRCERDITVHTIDHVSGDPVPSTEVSIDYTAHYLIKDFRLLKNEPVNRTITTDDNGDGIFTGLPCSVFSYIFYALSDASFLAGNECYNLKDSPEKHNFHYTREVTLRLQPAVDDVTITVTDRETDEPLAGAETIYKYVVSGEEVTDKVTTDAAGHITIPAAPHCGVINLDIVSCFGYKDTTAVEINVIEAEKDPSEAVVPLTPLKESFTFFVKNKFTRQPVPEATVEVTLTTGSGKVTRGSAVTNVDGKGRGGYDNAFVLADLSLKATKIHYKPGEFDRKCTVMEFAALPDSSRVIYLEPEPFTVEFQNVDSITGKPVPGATNLIKVHSIDGSTSEYTETSNRNGIFPVKAIEGDNIVIDSKCDPKYYPRHTDIPSFSSPEKIPMRPRIIDLTFRTLVAGTSNLLPGCTLRIVDSEGTIHKPDNSGSGEFTVKGLSYDVNISIVASKSGYEPNDYSVSDKNVKYLSTAPQRERDIPLAVKLPPCDASGSGVNNVKAGTVSAPASYNMGKDSGTFNFAYETGTTCPDRIDIYNHRPGEPYGSPIWSSGMVAVSSKTTVSIPFNKGSVITVIVTTGPEDGSMWEYHIDCPK
ncbi:MAG: hypothetical protein NC098_01975 [Lachnoclostridium sp.]|nr:hypothetical protein [Lachnoclostridium sp.]